MMKNGGFFLIIQIFFRNNRTANVVINVGPRSSSNTPQVIDTRFDDYFSNRMSVVEAYNE